MKKFITLALCLTLLSSILTGCAGNATPSAVPADNTGESPSVQQAEGDSSAAPDTSKLVEVKMLAIQNAPLNQEWSDELWGLINNKLKEKLNCTMTYEYIMGNDARNQYDLALASGVPYDLIGSGSLPGYAIPANKGAYKDLTDLLPVYAPDIWEKVTQEFWEQTLVNGKIYGIPTLKTNVSSGEFMYREDLRVKHNLPEIKDLDSIAAYLQGIKDNEPGLLPNDDFGAGCYGNIFISTTHYQGVDHIQEANYNFIIDPKNPRTVMNVMETEEYKEFMYLMKDWADKGYWPSSCLSNTEWGVNSVASGKSASSFNAVFPWYDWHPPFLERENPGWDIKFFETTHVNPDSFVTASPATVYMFSSTREAENTERGLMVLNLIQTDRDLWDLCRYGLEGRNYTMTEDGKVDVTQINAQTDMFNYFPMDNIQNEEFERVPTDRWDEYDDHMNYILGKCQPNPLAGFSIDLSPVEAQYTAINQLRVEFGMPLQAGLVDDVDAALANYIQKVKDAGIEECRAEFERQINAHLDAIGWDN